MTDHELLRRISGGFHFLLADWNQQFQEDRRSLECSPAKGHVEYPCIPRNGFATLVAIAAAEAASTGISLPGYGLDATLDRIFAIGSLLPQTLRETEDGSWAASLVPSECCGKGGCKGCAAVAHA